MWRPPERLRHELPPGGWPTVEQAVGSLLFSPLDSGRLQLAERSWVPAMVPWRATDEGCVTPEVIAWYERFARGQPGGLVVEATGIRNVPSGPLLRAGHDRFVPGLEQLATGVRRASGGRTRLFVQLIDFLSMRRRPSPATYPGRYLVLTDHHREALAERAASDAEIRRLLLTMSEEQLELVLSDRELEALRFGHRERVTDLQLEHVRRLPEVLPGLFAAAAARCERAGFDGVELHHAHAYTMASFLSPANTREDGWGGTLANRQRLALEVIAAVRAAVSESFVVGCRYLAEECFEGGGTVEDAISHGLAFAGAGLDFLSLSRGGKFEDALQPKVGHAAYPYTGPSGYECMPTVHSDAQGPFGRNLPATGRIRAALREAGFQTPVIAAGGLCSFEQCEALLRDGTADVAGAARQSLADPDWFLKMRLGRGEQVRRCKYTNYCEALDQSHVPVTCQRWDRLDLDEPGLLRTADGKRRLTAPEWTP